MDRLRSHAIEVCRKDLFPILGHRRGGDRKKILEAGFDGMQTKPIHVTEFFTAVEQALTNSAQPKG